MFRASWVGSFFGRRPGTGPSIASVMAHAVEKQTSKTPDRFGDGAIEGVVAPETANDAGDMTALISTLTLGMPGSATMALMLGALMVHGINPGPNLISEQPSLFWGLIMRFWIGNILLILLNLPLIGLWVRLLLILYDWICPAIIVFVCIGAYSVRYVAFDVIVVMAFGALGDGLRVFALTAAPLLLGFVLGPLVEQNVRQAMVLARGDFTAILARPISGVVLGLSALLLIWSGVSALRRRPVEAPADEPERAD